jgi:hypothetical protein
LRKEFDALCRDGTVFVDDFIYTEDEERGWASREPDFAKRIATPLPTKQRRRVTLRNNIYIEVLLEVTNSTHVR